MTNKTDYDNIELQIKKEQAVYKDGLSHNFLLNLNALIKKAMLLPKDKKELGVTEEMLNLQLLKLIQSQKKFKDSDSLLTKFRYTSILIKSTMDIGKVISCNFDELTFTYYTYSDKLNNLPVKEIKWTDVKIFDYNSMQMDLIYDLYKRGPSHFLSYTELYSFLSNKEFKRKNEIKQELNFKNGFGSIISNSSEHPIIQEVMETFQVTPEQLSNPPKRKLQKLDKLTLEVITEYNSVKEAESISGISASTISNVVCKGETGLKYIEAGGFKWQWSNAPNSKYILKRIELGIASDEDYCN